MKSYIGINNTAKSIIGEYIGVNGIARRVLKSYYGINGVAKLVYNNESGCIKEWENTSKGTYYFSKEDNKWISNNKNINSSTAESTWTVNLDYNQSYELKYGVSSQATYDVLTISLNGIQVASISGTNDESLILKLNAGTNVLSAKYSKNASVNTGTDSAYLILDAIEDHRYAEKVKLEPTCTVDGIKRVYCRNCGYSINEPIPALGHNWGSDNICTRCGIDYTYGLRDDDDNLLCMWENSGIIIDINYTSSNYNTSITSPYYVITKNYPSCTKLIIPDSAKITTIGNYAFNNCTTLKKIELPNTITNIGNQAFYCMNITELTIPGSISKISTYVLSNCSYLKKVKLLDGIKTISNYILYDCTSCKIVEIPPSVTSISKDLSNSSTQKIYILGELGSYAETYADVKTYYTFVPNSGVLSENINISLEYNDEYEFSLYINGSGEMTDYSDTQSPLYKYGSLYSYLNIGENITSIGSYAFQGFSNIKELTIPDSVTSIEDGAFNGCTNLTKLVILDNVISIGYNVFDGCDNLIIYGYNNSEIHDYCDSQGIKFVPMDGISGSCGNNVEWSMIYDLSTEEITLNLVGSDATFDYEEFSLSPWGIYADLIDNIEIDDNIDYLGCYLFANCSKLKNINLPNNITSIADGLFYECSSLNSFDFSNIISIGEKSFYNVSFTDITILNNVVNIGDNAFDNCSKINISCNFDSEIRRYAYRNNIKHTILDGILECGENSYYEYNISTKTLTIFGSGDIGFTFNEFQSSCLTVNISDYITSIPDQCFYNYYNLTNLHLPNNLQTVGDKAFSLYSSSSSSKLTELILPNTVTSIGKSCFNNRKQLTKLTLSDSLITIDDSSFESCGITGNIVIPNSVVYIGKYSFKSNAIQSIELGDNVSTIGDGAFSGNYDIKNINIPGSVSEIGSSPFPVNINSLTFEESDVPLTLKSTSLIGINEYVSSIVLPNRIAIIEKNIFGYSISTERNILELTLPNDTTAMIYSNAFVGVKYLHYTGNLSGKPWGADSYGA